VLLGHRTRRRPGFPVDHVVAVAVAVAEHRVDPAADRTAADQRLERHLDRGRPAVRPLAALELRTQLGQFAVWGVLVR
jgi:hypothetical protein